MDINLVSLVLFHPTCRSYNLTFMNNWFSGAHLVDTQTRFLVICTVFFSLHPNLAGFGEILRYLNTQYVIYLVKLARDRKHDRFSANGGLGREFPENFRETHVADFCFIF